MTKKNGDNVALYLFHQGNNMRAYEYMGVHKVKGEEDLFSVRVWAPRLQLRQLMEAFYRTVRKGGFFIALFALWCYTMGNQKEMRDFP